MFISKTLFKKVVSCCRCKKTKGLLHFNPIISYKIHYLVGNKYLNSLFCKQAYINIYFHANKIDLSIQFTFFK